jgi:hypothetical protein
MRTTESTVVVARNDLTSALRQRLGFDPAVLVFSAAEASDALSMIVNRNLPVIALDRYFASSPSGASFVSDVRSMRPESEIRILSDEGSHVPLLLRRPVLATGRATIAAGSHPLTGLPRRATRYPLRSGCEALVNGSPTALVNLSVTGAQLVSPLILRPSQEVDIALPVDAEEINLQAAVAWSIFERSRKTGETCYRAGLEFTDAEPEVLEAYCTRYGVQL